MKWKRWAEIGKRSMLLSLRNYLVEAHLLLGGCLLSTIDSQYCLAPCISITLTYYSTHYERVQYQKYHFTLVSKVSKFLHSLRWKKYNKNTEYQLPTVRIM